MQYSYLPSVLALPTEGAYGAESARALFRAVYGHWTQLPRDTRPALYVYGVSLGALNAERSFDAHDIIADAAVSTSSPVYPVCPWAPGTVQRCFSSVDAEKNWRSIP